VPVAPQQAQDRGGRVGGGRGLGEVEAAQVPDLDGVVGAAGRDQVRVEGVEAAAEHGLRVVREGADGFHVVRGRAHDVPHEAQVVVRAHREQPVGVLLVELDVPHGAAVALEDEVVLGRGSG
jgi:hypothetical protein